MQILSDVLLLAGGVWFVLAAVGVLRFDDVFSRMHAGTKAATLGLLLLLAGASLRLDVAGAAKAAVVAPLVFLTVPVGAHLIGRAVHRHRGEARINIDTVDELAEVQSED